RLQKAEALNITDDFLTTVHANDVEKIRNVVFMGMGEPLDNYDAVLGSIQAMINTSRFGLSPARISVSTVGVVPRIQALMRDVPQIGLALSLHAPTQELRQEIVPSSKSFSLSKILAAVFAFIENQNKANSSSPRHILIEYVLIENINSSVEVAHQLGQLFAARVDRKDILVNIIPYNPTDVIAAYEKPTPETLKEFVATVRSYGVHTLIRQELGQDIASACGQLVVKNQGIGKKLAGCDDEKEAKDLEDLVGAGKSVGAKPNVVKRTRKEDVKVEDTTDSSSDDKPAGMSIMTIAVAAVGLGLLSLAALRALKRK
ncbi:sorting nexin, partial [Chytriomyces hyalinus]